jgi:hypothetical protein
MTNTPCTSMTTISYRNIPTATVVFYWHFLGPLPSQLRSSSSDLATCLALICFVLTRHVDAAIDDKLLTTYAGTGKSDFNGDGIPANTATSSRPEKIAFDPSCYIIMYLHIYVRTQHPGQAGNYSLGSVTA